MTTETAAPFAPVEQHNANPFVRVARPRGLSRWIPGLAGLRTYQRPWLTKDLAAGLVLTAILAPVGMGYAEAAGLPAIYGLYATIVPLIVYAIFGPSRIPGLVLFRWDAPLFFVNAEIFREHVLQAVATAPTPTKWIIVAAEPVTDSSEQWGIEG
jgi:MFS superfamily sulfate permease-like transporter